MHNRGKARFIAASDDGLRVCAAAARISTTEGTALQVFEKGDGSERDMKLVKKVLSSGHKSLLEHHAFSIAFEDVSVLVEQFLIEFRLASFTVKSRRYVSFENAGFFTPDALKGKLKTCYTKNMEALFADYARLLELGIPREDARFVLPYCFLSNFYVSCNARELVNIICSMVHGRGARHAEIAALGMQLKKQFEAIYPGVLDAEKQRYERCAPEPLKPGFGDPHVLEPSVALTAAPLDTRALLQAALDFSGRFEGLPFEQAVNALTRDARPRELECLNFTFLVKNVSLASVTHYARHRIQSPMFRETFRALVSGGYVLPQSVRAVPEALSLYEAAFLRNHQALLQVTALGLSAEDASYFALAGNETDILITMNARELLHMLKLRTCARAQWEIRALCESLLRQLRQVAPTVFNKFGASCAVDGKCPEGRLSCGQPQSLPDEV